MRKIVLASSSPRRRELLESVGLKFVIDPAGIDEYMPKQSVPSRLVKRLALEKALAVVARHPDAIVIAADTIVAIGPHRWSKPENKREARMMVRTLSGKSHAVWTGFCIIDTVTAKRVVKAMKTRVILRRLSEKEITAYVATGEPMDAAGGYKIQEKGVALVAELHGDPNTVIGLPLAAVLRELGKFGVRS